MEATAECKRGGAHTQAPQPLDKPPPPPPPTHTHQVGNIALFNDLFTRTQKH